MLSPHRPALPFLRRTALWAALSLTLAGTAQAMTLARPVVLSRQGQPLLVEIDLTSLSNEEQSGLQAELADTDTYKASHIDPPRNGDQPLDVQVELRQRPDQHRFLRITSKQPVTPNQIDLLLKLRWASGQTLRLTSLSLDNDAPKPAAGTLPPTAPASSSPTTATSATAKPATTPTKPTAISPHEDGKHRVERGDTASQIVVQQMPDGVSLDQMLIALLRHNPDAFVDNNVNRLKTGALLTLPDAGQAKEVSRVEAQTQVRFQTQNFNAYRAELAARAGRGQVPKAERSSTGQLQAELHDKAAHPHQDKLTLSRPQDAAAKDEDKIAQQRQAQDVAKRAAELSKTVDELGQLAAQAASAVGTEGANLPTPPASATAASAWEELTGNTLAPVVGGALLALLVLLGLWRRHRRNAEDDDIQGLPPLNVKFNLDLPTYDEPLPDRAAPDENTQTPAETEPAPSPAGDTSNDAPAPAVARPAFDMPDISLELNEANAHPFQVRMDLAEELWKLGQLHTSRALMEEVAQEASGEIQTKARQWLAERS